MTRRFDFVPAFWFRVPLKVLVLCVLVFGFLSVGPTLTNGTPEEMERAVVAIMIVMFFTATATTFAVAVNDSYVEIDDESLYVRFEAFFNMEVPLADIVAVRRIDPRPRWRYRFGLSTNFHDRIACSHGGRFLEVELARPWRTRIWPRHIGVTRLWLAVKDDAALLDALRITAPQAFAAEYTPKQAA